MKRLMIIGLWPDDAVNYCTEKCDCRRYAFDRILYHRGGRAAASAFTLPEEVHEAMDKYIDENPAGKVELAQLLVNKAKGLI